MSRNDKIIGDKRTHGARNIPLFWNEARYTNENIRHCIASILFLLIGVVAIIYLVIVNIPGAKYHPSSTDQNAPGNIVLMTCGILVFIFLFTAIVLKIQERKIRKVRLIELDQSSGRKIEVN